MGLSEREYAVPLYIRDNEVAALAREVQAASGARTVTEAVRRALENERTRLRDAAPLRARLSEALAIADAMSPSADRSAC